MLIMSVVYQVAVQQKVVENMLEHQLDGTFVHIWISVHLILSLFGFSSLKKKTTTLNQIL